MLSSLDSVFGLSICCIFWYVYSFICPDRSCYHISWMAWANAMKLTGNIYLPLVMTSLDSGGQRLRSQQTVDVLKASTSMQLEVHLLV